jgi:hypothetical protein
LYDSANLKEVAIGMSKELYGSNEPQQVEREAPKVQASTDELVERIARAVHKDGTVEPLKGLLLGRASSPR